MRVVAKDEAGVWATWRVGRRRLAWRPDYKGWAIDSVDTTGIVLVLNVIPLAFYLLNWVAALVATTITWPLRATTSKWPVVAYSITTGDRVYRIDVQGRDAAKALAHRWALEIEQHGQPQATSAGA
ncbi:hypothetical protein AB0L86_26450 [Micromonospora musae]|uniref:hypothetical protein n=1 Tax=Micromonospora musae TaxID=1894970 RepID=UPI003423FC45